MWTRSLLPCLTNRMTSGYSRGGSGFALTVPLDVQVWHQERYEGRYQETPKAKPHQLVRFLGWTKHACGGWGGEASFVYPGN
jgi:hypothetical protein